MTTSDFDKRANLGPLPIFVEQQKPKPLLFQFLRDQSVARAKESFNRSSIHEWSETDWGCAAAGEMGELCNLLKKRRRGEEIPLRHVADEIADVVIYLDLLAAKLGVDLERAIIDKFNEVSVRVNSKRFL